MFLLLSIACAKHVMEFRGSVSTAKQVGEFTIRVAEKVITLDNVTVFSAKAAFEFDNSKQGWVWHKYSGINIGANSSFFFFRIETNNPGASNGIIVPVLQGIVSTLKNTSDKFAKADGRLRKMMANLSKEYRLMSFGFEMFANKSDRHFALDVGIKGIGFGLSTNKTCTLEGYMFDLPMFNKHGRVFGVMTALTMVLDWIAWKSLERNFSSSTYYRQLSIYSFIWHGLFDFCHGLFLFSIDCQSDGVGDVFIFLVFVKIVFYLSTPLGILTNIWKAVDVNDTAIEMMSRVFQFVFVLNLLAFWLSSSPALALFVVYSFFVPQIVYSFKMTGRRKNDNMFVVLTTLSRVSPLLYFGMCEGNFLGIKKGYIYQIIAVYVVVQMVVIVLQNFVGGTLFWPSFGHAYDYLQVPPPNSECTICLSRIPDDEEAMVTPCGHAYHKECLLQWMNERLECPVCRAPLPDVGV